MGRSFFKLVALAILITFTLHADATMLIIILTPDGYWIGADSLRSGEGGKFHELVCKVHETKYGLLVKSGRSQSKDQNGQAYSVDGEVLKLLESTGSLNDFKAQLRAKIKHDIDAELAYIINEPSTFPENVESKLWENGIPEDLTINLFRGITIFPISEAQGRGEFLAVKPTGVLSGSDSLGRPLYRYWARAASEWHPLIDIASTIRTGNRTITFPDSVRMLSYPVQYDRPNSWVLEHPQKALLEMLSKGVSEAPEKIGPPFVLVHVTISPDKTKEKITWHSRGVCPKWTTHLAKDQFLEQFRNQ
jgi:hypothetical protein